MRDGLAYVLRLKQLLKQNNEPLPVGIIVTEEMFESIKREYPAVCRFGEIFGCEIGMATVHGIKVYCEKGVKNV